MGNLAFSYAGHEAPADLFWRAEWRRWFALARQLRGDGGRRWPGLLRQAIPLAHATLRDVGTLRLLAPAFQAEAMRRRHRRPASSAVDARWRALAGADLGVYNHGALVGWGIEMRDPTADRRLIEFTLRLPPELFWHAGRSRAMARATLADRVPAAVLEERRRGYQAADWHRTLAGQRAQVAQAVERIAVDPAASAVIDVAAARALVAQWPTDRRYARVEQDYRMRLLPALSAGLFMCDAAAER